MAEKGETKAPAVAIGAIYVVASLVLLLKAGGLGLGLVFLLWVASPVAGGAWIGRYFRSELVSGVFYASVILAGIWGYYEQWWVMFVAPSDPQSALVFVIVPFYQWVLIGIAAAVLAVWQRYVEK